MLTYNVHWNHEIEGSKFKIHDWFHPDHSVGILILQITEGSATITCASLAAIHRVKGIKEETVLEWLRETAQHVEQIEALLLGNNQLTPVQLDALWTYVGHKGEKGDDPKKRTEALSGAEQR